MVSSTCCCYCCTVAALFTYPNSSKLLDNAADVMPSTRVLLQTPNNQNIGAIGGNGVSGDAIGDGARSGDARGGDARFDTASTLIDTKIDTNTAGPGIFG